MTRTATGHGPNTPTTRPSTARKVTRKTEEKRADALNDGLRVTIDGEAFEVTYGDITPAIAREMRRQVGFGWQGLMNQMAVDPDIDLLSAFVWVARRVRGEVVAFDDVQVTYADMEEGFAIDFAGSDGTEGDSPEA